jgi:hypothetical protein
MAIILEKYLDYRGNLLLNPPPNLRTSSFKHADLRGVDLKTIIIDNKTKFPPQKK